jgi:hypothetical protein
MGNINVDIQKPNINVTTDPGTIEVQNVQKQVQTTLNGAFDVEIGGETIIVEFNGTTAQKFTGLTDTPNAYTGSGGFAVFVNAPQTGLEFLQLTASSVGLGNVDNTSDANKPVSIATQNALNLKANTADLGTAAAADTTDFATAAQGATADSALQSVVAGTNITVDDTDPQNPIVASTASGGDPEGANQQVQFNNNGAFGGADMYWDNTEKSLVVGMSRNARELIDLEGNINMEQVADRSTNTAIPFTILGTGNVPVPVNAYRYFLRWRVLVDGQIRRTAAVQRTNNVANTVPSQIQLDIPVHPNPKVVGVDVYRNLSTTQYQFGTIFRATTINHNNGGAWIDNLPDSALDQTDNGFRSPNQTGGAIYINGDIAMQTTEFLTILGDGASGSGNSSVYIGSRAGEVSTGSNQVIIGYSAGLRLTTGGNNTLVGNTSGLQITVGGNNSGFGTATLRVGSLIHRNSVFGVEAARQIVDHSHDNCFFGYRSGRGSSGFSASRNACFGSYSLQNGLSVQDTTTLGYQAGSNLRTGAFNILIGSGAQARSTTDSRYLNIGDIITGDMNTSQRWIEFDGGVRVGDFGSSHTPEAGDIRYNSTSNTHEGYNGSTWNAFY